MVSTMNEYIRVVNKFLIRWKLTINTNECETILFRKYENYINKSQAVYKQNVNVKIVIGDSTITAKNTFKYLGVTFDMKCSTMPHVNNIIKKANIACLLLKSIFRKKELSTKIKVICYKQLIRPLLLYCFPGWCWASAHQLSRIRSLERKVLYKCLPLSKAYYYNFNKGCYRLVSKITLYREIEKINRFDIAIHNMFIRFCERIEFCDIPFLKNIFNHDSLKDRYSITGGKYPYKVFAPSLLFYLALENKVTNDDNVLTFYNRRFNCNTIDSFVYDLAEPP